ncbi:hypothetical protein GCM10010492_03850 [Saccharothrix mutabilis subsp. mutabilis]|uniref:PH domain-containing protein n=1 Tax=Saccharothrix mutabilis subsp. mutabilis TaxID=66855 RepID=A0ABN0T1E3_9PSEU
MTSADGDAFDAWRRALDELSASAEAAEAWRVRRYRYAHRLGRALTGVRQDGSPLLTGRVLYGVWLRWGLLYVGQTSEAERRLRDLVVGESHHLANTFPPEIWHRVVVVAWPRLPEAVALAGELADEDISLALEYRLQSLLAPLANASRRTPDGGWRPVDWTRSRSRGARAADKVDRLFTAVREVWEEAANAGSGTVTDTYSVAFPAQVLAE